MSKELLALWGVFCLWLPFGTAADWPFGALPAGTVSYVQVSSLDGADTGTDKLLQETMLIPAQQTVTRHIAAEIGLSELNGVKRNAPIGLVSLCLPATEEENVAHSACTIPVDVLVLPVDDPAAFVQNWTANPSNQVTTEDGVTRVMTRRKVLYCLTHDGFALVSEEQDAVSYAAVQDHDWHSLFSGTEDRTADLSAYINLPAVRALIDWEKFRLELLTAADYADTLLRSTGTTGAARFHASSLLSWIEQVRRLAFSVDVNDSGLVWNVTLTPESDSALANSLSTYPARTLDILYSLEPSGFLAAALAFDPSALDSPGISPQVKAVLDDSDGLAAWRLDFQRDGTPYLEKIHAIKDAGRSRAAVRGMLSSLVSDASLALTFVQDVSRIGDTPVDRVDIRDATLSFLNGRYDITVRNGWAFQAPTSRLTELVQRVEQKQSFAQSPDVAAQLRRTPQRKIVCVRLSPLDLIDAVAGLPPEQCMWLKDFVEPLKTVQVPPTPGLWLWAYPDSTELKIGGIAPKAEIQAIQSVWVQVTLAKLLGTGTSNP